MHSLHQGQPPQLVDKKLLRLHHLVPPPAVHRKSSLDGIIIISLLIMFGYLAYRYIASDKDGIELTKPKTEPPEPTAPPVKKVRKQIDFDFAPSNLSESLINYHGTL